MSWNVFIEGPGGTLLMFIVGGIFMYLGIKRGLEPLLLAPIGLGIILANIPGAGLSAYDEGGFLKLLWDGGIRTEVIPLLIFIGIGAMTDFGPFLGMPYTAFLGAAAQFGIFGTFLAAFWLLRFSLPDAASIGIIGSADGPTSIYVATKLNSQYIGAIVVAAYSYISMVPIIQRPIMKYLTTRKERLARMPYSPRAVSRTVRILFPIGVILITGLIAPLAVPLIGMLMFGNLLRESGVMERLSQTAQNEMINLVTLVLGISVGSTMTAAKFLHPTTLLVFALGVFAFALGSATGVILGKVMYYVTRGKVNPIIGACGVSAFPMSARLAQQVASEEDFSNFVLMQAMGANTCGQIASALAGGVLLMAIQTVAPALLL